MDLLEKFGRTVKEGETVFSQGELGDAIYVIQSGKIRLSQNWRGDERVLLDLGSGEFFGEMAIINQKPRSATARAVEDTSLLVLSPMVFENMIKANTEIAVRMVKKFTARLEMTNERIEGLLHRDAGSRVTYGLLRLARARGEAAGEGRRLEADADALERLVGIASSVVLEQLAALERAELLRVEDGKWWVATEDKLMEYVHYLELKELYGEV